MTRILRQWLRTVAVCLCFVCFVCSVQDVFASDIKSLEKKSSNLEKSLNDINAELRDISTKIAENESAIEVTNNDIVKTQEQLAIARKNEEAYYADMKVRIQYIYENSGESMLGMIFAAESMADFVNKVQFVQELSKYDRDMFHELQELRQTIEAEEEHLKDQQEACLRLENELNANREELNAKAAAASADLQSLEIEIQNLKAQQIAKAQEEAAAAAREAAAKEAAAAAASNSGNKNSSNSPSGNNSSSGNSSSSGGSVTVTYPSGNGVLTPSKGVNYYNGHRETYYSQKVLPGNGLNIPGRHVASDGTIRDENGYICVASSDYPKGTIVETSLGTGKVYDTGCASGTIDLYTNW